MAGLSSPGLGSGLDVNSIVSQLMALEQRPITALNFKEASYQAKLTAYGSLKGALSAVQSTAKALTLEATFVGRTATVSDPSVLSASAGSTAAAGSYTVNVTQLAKYHAVRSGTNYAATTDTFTTGSLAIKVGAGATVNVTIDGTNNTLAGIRQAINDAGAGVTATIVNDGSTNRLVLTSTTPGSAGAIAVTATDSASGGTHALTGLDSAGLVQTQPADDAEFSVNGIAITRSSNTVSDVIDGVSINLIKVGSSSLTVSQNTAATTNAINSFVKTYNDAVKQLQSSSAYDAANKRASVLTGDSTVRGIGATLRGLVQGNVSGIEGGIATLSSIGIALQKDGTLVVDSSKLAAALANPAMDVAALFTSTSVGNEGIAVRFNGSLSSMLDSSGLIASRTDGITASIKDIGQRRDALSVRLLSIESRYRAQYSALDSLIAGMNQTSQYLTQQLANLPGTSSSN
ncbi:MAG: flagellar filament capping protein FliD [Burkholderiaceae bacterium]|nr:flagellar filament capping protein FliD [Sulfuritalea sp.]MCF8176831.1 flagellar filament capping protein FliD [Burkholderiaceae bacterium]